MEPRETRSKWGSKQTDAGSHELGDKQSYLYTLSRKHTVTSCSLTIMIMFRFCFVWFDSRVMFIINCLILNARTAVYVTRSRGPECQSFQRFQPIRASHILPGLRWSAEKRHPCQQPQKWSSQSGCLPLNSLFLLKKKKNDCHNDNDDDDEGGGDKMFVVKYELLTLKKRAARCTGNQIVTPMFSQAENDNNNDYRQFNLNQKKPTAWAVKGLNSSSWKALASSIIDALAICIYIYIYIGYARAAIFHCATVFCSELWIILLWLVSVIHAHFLLARGRH